MNKEIIEVSVDDIVPNRFQPRLNFDEKELKNLSDSIKAHGIIQPLVLRRLGDKYEIIAGERRYKASIMAGLTKVPAIIKDIDDSSSAELAVIENVQRKNLSSIEEALSYQKILNQGAITQDQLASRLGIAQSTLANKLRLLNLTEDAQQALLKNQISERHARSLLSIKDENKQKEMLNRIISERLTVKQTDEEISKMLGTIPTSIEEPIMNLNDSKANLNGLLNNEQNAPQFDISMLLKKQDNSVQPSSPEPQDLVFTHTNTEESPTTITPEPIISEAPIQNNLPDFDNQPNLSNNQEIQISPNIVEDKEENSLSSTTISDISTNNDSSINSFQNFDEAPTFDQNIEESSDNTDNNSSSSGSSIISDLLSTSNTEPIKKLPKEDHYAESTQDSFASNEPDSTTNTSSSSIISDLLSINSSKNMNSEPLTSNYSPLSSKSFEDITPNLDNIFSSYDNTPEPELSSKPVIEEPFLNPEIMETNNEVSSNDNIPKSTTDSTITPNNSNEYQPLGFNAKKKVIEEENSEPEILELDFEESNNVQTSADATQDEEALPFDYDSIDFDYIEEDRSLKSAINKARDLIEKIKATGFDVDSEEVDFAEEYQIIIKIKKEPEDE